MQLENAAFVSDGATNFDCRSKAYVGSDRSCKITISYVVYIFFCEETNLFFEAIVEPNFHDYDILDDLC